MALHTMKGVEEINGTKVLQERIYFPCAEGEKPEINWPATDEARKDSPIFVDHDVNMISFRIQNGPVKEKGKNGCQVEDIIAVAKHMIEKLNEAVPCHENEKILLHLEEAMKWSYTRTTNRQNRNVEGTSQA